MAFRRGFEPDIVVVGEAADGRICRRSLGFLQLGVDFLKPPPGRLAILALGMRKLHVSSCWLGSIRWHGVAYGLGPGVVDG